MGMNPKADFFFSAEGQWQEAYSELRKIALDSQLQEEVKWGCPCYTLGDANIVLIHGFKEYCALLFFKGALVPDAEGMLIQQTENVQAARQMRFTSVPEIVGKAALIKTYILQAITVEKAGLKVAMKKTVDYAVPEEFAAQLKADANLNTAFEALTPGRQRAYLYHFSQPKTTKTRAARVQTAIPRILDGKGLDD